MKQHHTAPDPGETNHIIAHSPPLTERHERMLGEESGIDPSISAQRGYQTISTRAELPPQLKSYQRRAPALLVPTYSPSGTRGFQIRPDKPRQSKSGKAIKYETPSGAEITIDVHPRMLDKVLCDPGTPLFVTEGVKCGDSLTSKGEATVSLIGVWGWQRDGKPLPCWDHVALEGRHVFVVFDSDVMTKEGVQAALERLVKMLEHRGAAVRVVYLPEGDEKVGVDDFLAAGGTIDELKALARHFEPEDIAKIKLSRNAHLRAMLEDLERTFWAYSWKGMGGHSARDIFEQLISWVARTGKPHQDGVRVKVSNGTLIMGAKVSSRTLWKGINRLEEAGLLYRDNEGRHPDKTGAFVLRASVRNEGKSKAGEGKVTSRLQTFHPGSLHLRTPRLRWSQPKYTPRRGTCEGTRRVRQGPPPKARPAIKRLGKIRGAILDALDAAGGTASLQEIADALHRKRPRDIRRRDLPMLEEAGILSVDGDVVRLADDWLGRLDEMRKIGKEIEADEVTRHRLKAKSKAFRDRNKTKADRAPSAEDMEARHHAREAGPDGTIEQLQRLPDDPLIGAIDDYLKLNPGDALQPPGWIANTLWCWDLIEGKPTIEEVRVAVQALGGDTYLRRFLEQAA